MIYGVHQVRECLWGVVVEYLSDPDRLCFTFNDYVVNVSDLVGALELLVGEVTD